MELAAGSDARAGRPILEVLGLVVVAFAVSTLFGVAFLVPAFVLGYDVGATWVLLGATGVGQVGFLLVGYAYVRWRGIRVRVAVPTGRDLAWILAPRSPRSCSRRGSRSSWRRSTSCPGR